MSAFIILADLRTGSTLLSSTLDRHPEVRCYGELLHPEGFADNQLRGCDRFRLGGGELVRRALDDADVEAAGFRAMIFLPRPSQPQWADAWDHLEAREDLRVVSIRRRDRLAQYASLKVAERTGLFHPHDGDPVLKAENRPRIDVDPEAFVAWVEERERLWEVRRRRLRGKPWLELDHETLSSDWAPEIASVQEFLGVARVNLEPAKRKQETRPLEDVIRNFDHVRSLQSRP